ncbi:MAG: TonB-dependent siderophore receptor [Acidobacteriota bacterium]
MTLSKAFLYFLSFLLFIFPAFSPAANAQTGLPLYRVQGRIVDANNAIVSGAKVSLNAAGTQSSFTTVTDAKGEFFLEVPENEYSLTVSAEGFARESQELNVRQTGEAPLEISLDIGTFDAVVTVTGTGEYGTELITSATKTDTPLINIPQSISVISKQQIQDQGLSGIGDVVRYLPGITAHQGENNRDQLIIRGQSSSADFYINGVRDDVQYYRDLYNLDRVEALKGPNAMVFGRGGGGGVVNRVTKQAEFASIADLTFQGGMFGNKRVTGDFGRPLSDKFAFRANGVFEDSDSFRKFVGLQRFGIAPTVTFAPDSRTRLTLGYEYFRDRRTADRGITSVAGRPVDVARSTFFGNPDDSHVKADVNIVAGTFERQLGRLNVRNRTQFGDYDRFYQNYVPGAVNAGGNLVTLSAYNNVTRRKNFFNQTDLTMSVQTGILKHTLLGGFEFGNQRTRNFRNTGYFNNATASIQVALDDPTTNVPTTFRQSAADADNNLRLNLAAGYLQDQIEITRFVQVVAGVRLDYFDLNYHNNRTTQELNRIDSLVSPRLGLVIKPVEQLSLYGSYSVSYLPSSGDQFSSLTNVTQQAEPEKFENYEVGVKWNIRHNVALTSALYRLNRTNTRATDPNDPTRIIQTGRQRTNGFEVGINGSMTDKWNVVGGYAFQDAFISSATAAAIAGKQVAQVPHHSFTLWNKYQLMSKLSVGLGVINRSDMFAAIDNSVVLPGYTRADAAVYYTFNENWRVQANIENVFGRRYFANADSNTNISFGSPTAVRVGLVARFW